jgi:nitrate/nitrite transporter NarK
MSERLRLVTIALLMACQSTQAVAMGGVAMLLPLIREDLGLNFSQSGMIGVASGLSYALMQIPAGTLCDRLGARRLFIVGMFGTNATMITFALIDNYHLLLANQVVSGLFRSLVFAPGLLLMQTEFPDQRRATASGLFLVGGLASNMLINLFGPAMLPLLGWRMLLGVCAASVLVIALAYAAIGEARRPVAHHGAGEPAGIGHILRSNVIWWAASTHFARHAVAMSWAYWLTTILVTEKGFPLAGAAGLIAMGSAVTMLANVVGGYLSDRFQKPMVVISIAFFMMAVALTALTYAHGLAGVAVAVFIASAFLQFAFGPMFAYPVRIFGAQSAGFISGFSNTCANAGGLTGAFVVGYLKDVTGDFATGLYALVALCLVAIAATGMLDRAGRRHLIRSVERQREAEIATAPAMPR